MSNYEQDIRATEVNPAYEGVVENILRDKANRWQYDYYKEGTTGYDVHVGRAVAECRKYTLQIKKHETALNTITATLDASRKDPKHPDYKKLTAKQVEALETEYTDICKLKCEQMVLLDGAQATKREVEWKQYVQKKRIEMIQAVRNTFMNNGDEDFMARGVTWAEEYNLRLQAMS